MRKLIFMILLLSGISVSGKLIAQNITVKGTIKSATDSMAIPGATVVVKGTTNGTITDLDGNFSITVPDRNSILQVSFIGMETQEILVGDNRNFAIAMAPSIEMLNEVVVTALGIKRESKALGYSVSEIQTEEMVQARDVNLINSISGKVAGLMITQTAGGVGSSSRIIIRGNSSLSGNNQPLFVVDGVPIDNTNHDTPTWLGGRDYGSGISDISPDDIETISVLKGPNAAALYGSRAANGVILITTKGGKKGQKKATISFNHNTTFDRAYIITEYQNEFGLGFNGSISSLFALSPEDQARLGRDSMMYYYGTGSWGPKMQGQEILNWNGEIAQVWPQPNNVRDYFEKGYTVTNSVSVDGGGERTNYRLSYVDLRNKGISPNSRYSRNSINFRSNTKVNDKIDLDFKVNYIYEDAFNRVGVGDARTGSRTFIWMPRSTNVALLKRDMRDANGYEQNWYFDDPWHTNPYWEAYRNINKDNKDRILGTAMVNVELLPWLKFAYRAGTDFYKSRRFDQIANKSLREPEGRYTERWIAYRSINHEAFFSVNKKLSENFEFSMITGGNSNYSLVDINSNTINGLAIPDFFSLNNAKYPATNSIGTSKKEKAILSVYGSAQLAFRNFWFVDVTARNDWSSTLPLENNSYFYPSISTSLVLTDLFDTKGTFFDFGKIRASWAQVGNDAEAYQLKTSFVNQAFGEYPTNFISSVRKLPTLKPEITTSIETGGDLRFFGNRLGLDITYYDQSTRNQILNAEISKPTGFDIAVINAGEIRNRGIEALLTLKPIRTSNFDWLISFNYARNRSEVVSLAKGVDTYTITSESQMQVVAEPGKPYGVIIGSTIERYYKRDPEGNILPDKNNGKPLVNDEGLYNMGIWKEIGNVTPDWTGGIVNELNYRGLSFSFTVGVKIGGDIFSKTNKYGLDNGQYVQTLPGRASWYAANDAEKLMGRKGMYNPDGTPMLDGEGKQIFDVTSDPVGYVAEGVLADGTINNRGINPQVYWHQYKWGGIAELSTYDASYVKLREVIIGYALPKKYFKKMPISDLRFSVVGRNLWLIYSGVPNIDPEITFSSMENGLGQEYASLPTTRSIGFNININF